MSNRPELTPSVLTRDSQAIAASGVTGYVWACITLAVVTFAAVIGISLVRPNVDNTSIIAAIIGFSTPVMLALLALMQRENHVAMNSRLSELIAITRQASHAEGVTEGEGSKISVIKPPAVPK